MKTKLNLGDLHRIQLALVSMHRQLVMREAREKTTATYERIGMMIKEIEDAEKIPARLRFETVYDGCDVYLRVAANEGE